MAKRWMAFVLALAMLLSLMTGCAMTKEAEQEEVPIVEDKGSPARTADKEGPTPISAVEEATPSQTKKDAIEADSLPAAQNNPYLDENNALTAPFDIVYPDVFESGEVTYSDETVLVKFKPGFDGKVTADMTAAGLGKLEELFTVESGKWYEGYLTEGTNAEEAMAKIRALDGVLVAEYNFEYEAFGQPDGETTFTLEDSIPDAVKENPRANEQWILRSCGIGDAWAYSAQQSKPVAGEGTVVAVIDTGVDYNHEDLKANMWVNNGEIPDNGIDDDGNGCIDDYYGMDYVNGKGSADDDNGHGTHVAGIIAAANNKTGVVGVAYNAKIMAIKAGNASGYFLQSDIAKAIKYAYDNGADVINMSFGGTASTNVVQDALELAYTRCILVAAAGNAGAKNEGFLAIPNYPAAFKFVLGVMSVDRYGKESSFTNYDVSAYNSVEYEVYAPGTSVLSTIPGDRYASWSGTSMAAPVVSGMAAMLRADFNDPNTYPTKYIYGQIAATGGINATCYDPEIHGFHNLPQITDVYRAMTELPKPELGIGSYTLFDTETFAEGNNGDGVIDAGETIALGFTIDNRWGMSRDTVLTVSAFSQADIPNPYVTFSDSLNGEYDSSASVNYGSVGTYSEKDAGRIVTNDAFTGWENPFYIKVAKNCPNDMLITVNVNLTAKNGLDENDHSDYTSGATVTLTVRRGIIISGAINADQHWTKDNYYIIANSTIINPGVTVTVDPGTQIQFWSNDPEDAYADTAITYLRVDGTLLCEGTPEERISIFPSELMGRYQVEIYANSTASYVSLKNCDIVNPYLHGDNSGNLKLYGCEFTQNYKEDALYYRYLSGGTVYKTYHNAVISCYTAEYCSFYKVGGDHSSFAMKLLCNCKNCIFVDSNIQFGGKLTDCVFYGNNNYWDSDSSGAASTVTLSKSASGVVGKLAYNPENGHTYLRYDRNVVDEQRAEALAQQLGGYLASLETPEEREFVCSAFSGYGNYNNYHTVGLYKDGTGYRWASGAALDPSVTVTENMYSRYKYAILTDDGYCWSVKTNHILIEIPGPIYVDDIGLERGSVTLDLEQTYQIVAHPQPDPKEELIYRSMNTDIVTVDETGLVTPKSKGTTQVYVYAPDESSYSILQVTVVDVVALTALTLTTPAETLAVGNTMMLSTTLTPADTTKRTVIYTSSNEAVATVDEKGVVTGVAPGDVTITAIDESGTVTCKVKLTVVIPATGITLGDGENYFCAMASSTNILPYTLTPADTTQKELFWESSKPEVAEVDAEGNLICRNPGNAVIRATIQNTDIYDEIIVMVSDTQPLVDVMKMQEVMYNSKYYQLALLSDGTVLVWGNNIKQPTAMAVGGKHIVDIAAYYATLWLLDDTGDVYEISFQGSPDITMPEKPLLSKAAKFAETYYLRAYNYSYIYAISADGGLWQLESYGNEPVQMNAAQVTAAVSSREGYGVTYLTKNGSLCYLQGVNSEPQLLDTGVTALYSDLHNSQDCYAKKGGSFYRVYMSSFGATYPLDIDAPSGEPFVIASGNQYYIDSGVLYVKGSNYYGELGLGHTNGVSNFVPVPGLENVTKVIPQYRATFVQTADGKLYAMGRGEEGQLVAPDTVVSTTPIRVYIGLTENEGGLYLERTNLTGEDQGAKSLGARFLTLDFSEAILNGSGYSGINLKDSKGGMVSIQKERHLDKLTISPLTELTAGETYTLTLPAGSVTNYLSASGEKITLTFTYWPSEEQMEQPEQPEIPEQPETPEIPETPEVTEEIPETVILNDLRHYWTIEEAHQVMNAYENTYNQDFIGNAVLNRTNNTNVETWFRVNGNSASNYTRIPLGGNYWGSTNETLIGKQIVDFDDYITLADIDTAGYLTEAPEDVWPFVVRAGLKTKAGEVTIVGNETVTFCVDFNRDMDTTIPLQVRFGSTYPYADYEVSGEWITARHWEGTTTLTTLIENGVQCWSIDNGRSADEMHLKLYKDWGRFTFGIDTTQALAMTMQAEATPEGISLSWAQDDFDTLAGYNVYRSTAEDGLYTRLNKTILPADTKEFFDENIEPGQVYYYNFTVVKTDMTESTPSGKIVIQAFDTMAPNIYHTPVYTAFTGNKIGISATVTDNVVVQSAKLFYRVTGTENWKSLPMTASNDKFSAFVPVTDVTVAGVDYYIEAFDGNSYTYRGSAEDPFNITVQYKPDANALGDVDGDGAITVNDALMILQANNDQLNLTEEQFARADINGDGELSAMEAMRVIYYVNGKITSIPF